MVEIPKDSAKEYNLQLAYATSIHKMQGSEFPCAVVITHKSHSFMHHRNLLYTAVTRAQKSVIMLGDHWGIENCAKKQQVDKRNTFLSFLLHERAGGRNEGPGFQFIRGCELLPNAVPGLEADGSGVARCLPGPPGRRRQLRGEPQERTCVLPLAVRPRVEHPATGAGTVPPPVERMPPGSERHRRAADPGAGEIDGGRHL